MKVLVCVKRVVDYNVKVRVKSDGSGVDLANVKMSMNPFDEIAVEEAIRQKEAGVFNEVILLSVGPQAAQDVLRTGLAMGADRAILVKTGSVVEPLNVAKAVKAVTENEKPDMVFLGKQAIDDDSNQTGQMLAALLAWPQATFASKLEIAGEKAIVAREVDSGIETIAVTLPAVLTVDLRLNEPRYASLPNIMKAKKKTIDETSLEELGIDASPRLSILNVEEPQGRKAGIKVASAEELVAKLKNEAGIF
ncbi:electron transfer flavoprotein subunit beta/FixA family protein [Bartonella sp. HY329]|uniref:electron transfer flavoprotein subunit beta/FixA family protein n=1 Tax=unclassified Bartonella TaxID=2645622 RepID=UPI0021C79E68|nr:MULTISPECIES: electron transfer flavoprotein subunit beta/FixA family protein [unclassified Bartonella]UXM94712.1 electron transfer flavoprotein subunit beta/FixA family protein [Bartonella sp. HY329]UXN09035.1 electron transfer flavoprotein subunit beta/FixA family protein [Bartonella sp. HY328]